MAWYWPFGRQKKQEQKRAYAAAKLNRLLADWVAGGTSADSEIKGSLQALRDRTRQLARDNDYVRQFLRALENNVIGQGIPFQAQVRMQRGPKLNESINDAIETAWSTWTRKQSCHTAGLLSFNDIERLCVRSVAEGGEIFIRMIDRSFGNSKVPMALEIIEADYLDHTMSGRSPGGNEIRMGVEVDQWNRPVAYHFRKRHPGDYLFTSQQTADNSAPMRVPASEIIHLYRMERPSQTRGVPWLASAILNLHHLQGYQEATVIAARASAALMGFVESEQGELVGDSVDGYDRLTDFQPGVFKYLAPGEKVSVPSLDRPNGEFDPFMRAMLRAVSAGVGCSYETISRDYSQSNYSSSRLALLDDRDHWRVLQRWMIENFHQIVFERWLDRAVLSGALSLPGYELAPERYSQVKWMPRGWAWVDPSKEVDAYRQAVRSGFITVADVISQSGSDIEELMLQRKREVDLADSMSLIFDTDPKQVSNAGLTQARPQGTVLPITDGTEPTPIKPMSPVE